MIAPGQVLQLGSKKMKKEWKLAFLSALIIGLFIHLPMMLSDIPNHDGLASMYFDQNMITSGRWFLTVACGISSYFTLPWLIGLLGMFYLSLTAVALTELLELHDSLTIVLASGLLVAFPSLSSTFAYVFTLDGYMMALFLAVLAVLLVGKYRLGFVAGGICLAFSMGIYQAYLPFAILLCIYCIIIIMMEKDGLKNKILCSLKYLYMGGIGVALYYILLHILLKIQGKELASYQGISGMGGAAIQNTGLTSLLRDIYHDFVAFTLKSHVFFNNRFSLAGMLVLVLLCVSTLGLLMLRRKWWKKPGFFVIMGLLAVGVPIATNIILVVSPNVTYHLLMRYQWVLFLILMLAFINRYLGEWQSVGKGMSPWVEWCLVGAVAVLVFNYAVTDNIAYSNLEKRYEKTYAYCVRLLDRIEQTEGYYQGIPIAMVGVIGDEQYPATDITGNITNGMIGMNGDWLLYTSANYEEFMKNYLGATLNFLDVDRVGEIYYTEEYAAMDSFPGENSVKVVDGILYVKTENFERN
ncbi:MAG: glucosyltransferase domain-containing protein [Lachnospiraceae bacterium]|nr:glucosyltransferase domain-containing protein [Lachnospiraceae bacterium]